MIDHINQNPAVADARESFRQANESGNLFVISGAAMRLAFIGLVIGCMGYIAAMRSNFGQRYYAIENVILPVIYQIALLVAALIFIEQLDITFWFFLLVALNLFALILRGVPLVWERITKQFPLKAYSYHVGTSWRIWQRLRVGRIISTERDFQLVYESGLLLLLAIPMLFVDIFAGLHLLVGSMGCFFVTLFVIQIEFQNFCDQSDAVHMQDAANGLN